MKLYPEDYFQPDSYNGSSYDDMVAGDLQSTGGRVGDSFSRKDKLNIHITKV